ncbi:hypothetical protein HAX54_001732 [Datura stramonium]|uniref:Uncharacterized protein n=1 Tax=Datura stramonium TaxID=4076 RepID=A0ABS8RU98_DATST|nr:hypothetical protein [Datura stramonium]
MAEIDANCITGKEEVRFCNRRYNKDSFQDEHHEHWESCNAFFLCSSTIPNFQFPNFQIPILSGLCAAASALAQSPLSPSLPRREPAAAPLPQPSPLSPSLPRHDDADGASLLTSRQSPLPLYQSVVTSSHHYHSVTQLPSPVARQPVR